MRAIWVSGLLPHPAGSGGRAHEFDLIRAVADRHEIEVVHADRDDSFDAGPLDAIGVRSTPVAWQPAPYPEGRVAVARGLLRARPNLALWTQRSRIPALGEAVREVSARFRPDLVHVNDGGLAGVLPYIDGPTALLLFDVLSRDLESQLSVERLRRRRLKYWLESRWTRKYELDAYARATGVASVSDVDAAWLEQRLGRSIEVVENPINESFFEEPTVARSNDLVLFVGSLFWAPNTDAVEWLASDILPRLRRRGSTARLRVVGRSDTEKIVRDRLAAQLASAGGELCADVDDIRPHYWEAAVSVAPIRFGTGLRNKVIHAMACGSPVVATTAALEGVPPAAAQQALTGETADELAEAILTTLADPASARARARAAAPAVESLRADVIGRRLEDWWKRLVT